MESMTAQELQTFNPEHGRAIAGVDRRTWRRWTTGEARIPHAASELLRIACFGVLPFAGTDWAAWRFADGKLWDPTGQWHTAGTIQAWWWTAQQLQAARAEVHEQRRDLPAGVVAFPRSRPEQITEELYRRLQGG